MKKEDIKVVISDIDGTLITDYDELPDNFIEMVDRLNEMGIIFVAASGRGANSIKNKLQYEADNLYIISDNGSIIMKGDDVIAASQFTALEYKELIEYFRSFEGNTIGVATLEGSYVEIGSKYADEKLLDEFFHGSVVVDDILNITGTIVGLSVHNKHNTYENYNSDYTQQMLKKYTLVQAGANWIDAIPSNNNKGTAVKTLLNIVNLTTDQTIAFGDYNNDIEMLQTVGRGFAMEDATDDLKAIADEIIGSNNDNSVIKKIYELLEI